MSTVEQSILWMLRGRAYRIGPTSDKNSLVDHLQVSRREIEEAIQSLRKAGHPIVGDSDGLHLTDDPDEILRYIKVRQGRASELYLGNRALRLTARRLKEAADQEAGLTLWPAA